jgi:hypothetical protein
MSLLGPQVAMLRSTGGENIKKNKRGNPLNLEATVGQKS